MATTADYQRMVTTLTEDEARYRPSHDEIDVYAVCDAAHDHYSKPKSFLNKE